MASWGPGEAEEIPQVPANRCSMGKTTWEYLDFGEEHLQKGPPSMQRSSKHIDVGIGEVGHSCSRETCSKVPFPQLWKNLLFHCWPHLPPQGPNLGGAGVKLKKRQALPAPLDWAGDALRGAGRRGSHLLLSQEPRDTSQAPRAVQDQDGGNDPSQQWKGWSTGVKAAQVQGTRAGAWTKASSVRSQDGQRKQDARIREGIFLPAQTGPDGRGFVFPAGERLRSRERRENRAPLHGPALKSLPCTWHPAPHQEAQFFPVSFYRGRFSCPGAKPMAGSKRCCLVAPVEAGGRSRRYSAAGKGAAARLCLATGCGHTGNTGTRGTGREESSGERRL